MGEVFSDHIRAIPQLWIPTKAAIRKATGWSSLTKVLDQTER